MDNILLFLKDFFIICLPETTFMMLLMIMLNKLTIDIPLIFKTIILSNIGMYFVVCILDTTPVLELVLMSFLIFVATIAYNNFSIIVSHFLLTIFLSTCILLVLQYTATILMYQIFGISIEQIGYNIYYNIVDRLLIFPIQLLILLFLNIRRSLC